MITGDDRFPFFSRRVDRPQGKEHYKNFDKTNDPRGNFKCVDEWGYVDGRSSKVHVAFWHKTDDMYFPVHGDLTSENISAQLYIIFGKWKKKMDKQRVRYHPVLEWQRPATRPSR